MVLPENTFLIANVVAFAETDNEELMSYAILTVAVLVIIYFAIFVDSKASEPERVGAPVVESHIAAPSTPAVATPIPTAPTPTSPERTVKVVAPSPKAPVTTAETADGDDENEASAPKTPLKKRTSSPAKKRSSTPNKRQQEELGHLLSPDGRRVSARLHSKAPRDV